VMPRAGMLLVLMPCFFFCGCVLAHASDVLIGQLLFCIICMCVCVCVCEDNNWSCSEAEKERLPAY